MKQIILKRNEDGSVSSTKLGSYEGAKDDTSAKRSHLLAEPQAAHFKLPEGMDEDCVEPVEVDGVVSLQENADKVLAKRQSKAQSNLDAIRALRQPLLDEADHEINTMEDDGVDASAMRAYRKALRECTESLKKVDGEAKLSCESLIPSEFVFPTKP
jgi:hypothetical protein